MRVSMTIPSKYRFFLTLFDTLFYIIIIDTYFYFTFIEKLVRHVKENALVSQSMANPANLSNLENLTNPTTPNAHTENAKDIRQNSMQVVISVVIMKHLGLVCRIFRKHLLTSVSAIY